MTRKELAAEQAQAKRFLDFVDRVALALYGKAYEDCSPSQRAVVLERVEALHMQEIN